MIVRAHWGLRSNHSPSSTMWRITSYMSYGLRLDSGQDVEQLLVAAVDRVGGSSTGGGLLAVLGHEGQVAP